MKKGFTLIELLAVIVILAIIALIATPIVLNIINDTKESAGLRSADFYLDAVEFSIANATLNNNGITDGSYSILENGDICLGYDANKNCTDTLQIEVKGEKPSGGTITIVEGVIHSSILKLNNKEIGQYRDTELLYTTYKPGDVIYFDVSTGDVCGVNEYHEDNSKTGYNGLNGTGNQNGCLKFYVIKDLGGALDLILDHNTTEAVAWITQEEYNDDKSWNEYKKTAQGPKTLVKQLKADTDSWLGVENQPSYTLKKIVDIPPNPDVANSEIEKFQIEYKVEYNKARIITANEIAWITGNTGFDERTNYSPYYFDTLEYDHLTRSEACLDNNPSTECKYGWLYDRTSNTCTNSGCFNNADTNNAYGYWTSTAASHTYYPFFVHAGGQIAYVDSVETSTSNGVRPVITILKSKR